MLRPRQRGRIPGSGAEIVPATVVEARNGAGGPKSWNAETCRETRTGQRARVEVAMDKVRDKFGEAAVEKGRGFRRTAKSVQSEKPS